MPRQGNIYKPHFTFESGYYSRGGYNRGTKWGAHNKVLFISRTLYLRGFIIQEGLRWCFFFVGKFFLACFQTILENKQVFTTLAVLILIFRGCSPKCATDKWPFNPNWHELRNQEKCSSLATPRSKFNKTQWAWQGVKLTQLMLIFTSKKVVKFLIKIQLTKSNLKITRGVKVPCLMPIRVKTWN